MGDEKESRMNTELPKEFRRNTKRPEEFRVDTKPTFINSKCDGDTYPIKRSKRISISVTEAESAPPFVGSDIFVPHDRLDVKVIELVEATETVKKLRCVHVSDRDQEIVVNLEGIWASTPCQIGSSLRILGARKLTNVDYSCDWSKGMVLINNETLVPCTTIVQSVSCKRKAVLNHYFKNRSAVKAFLIGNIVHSLFQLVLSPKITKVDKNILLGIWREELNVQFAQEMIALDILPDQMEDELANHFETIIQWNEAYMPPPRGRNQLTCTGSRIKSVSGIEESIWDDRFGLKAKLDVCLEMERNDGVMIREPLELKTGSSYASVDHSAQVMLYCLALGSKRADHNEVGKGSLLYIDDGTARAVVPKHTDVQALINLRNELASYISSNSIDQLPGPLQSSRICQWCSQKLVCSILQKRDNDQNSPAMTQFVDDNISHLSQNHIEYFIKWCNWVVMEFASLSFSNCIAKEKSTNEVHIKKSNVQPLIGTFLSCTPKPGGKQLAVFTVHSDSLRTSDGLLQECDMLSIHSTDNDFIVIGAVDSIQDDRIIIALNGLNLALSPNCNYILDKYESSSIFTLNLSNIISLMNPSPQMTKIRSLIIDLRPPAFSNLKKSDIVSLSSILKTLNRQQAQAVIRSLMANDYCVVQGYPGTGKTSFIVALIRCLIQLHQSVIVTSHTHSAVDNILIKLLQFVDAKHILRIGKSTSIRSEIRHLTLDEKLLAVPEIDKFFEIRRILNETPVVACTCLGASSDLLFTHRKFSVTLVDEASLILESGIIPSLAAADKFVLVGDHKQLNPLVRCKAARNEGMNKSLSERLEIHNSAITTLSTQYRMNRSIAELCSSLFYDGKLACANEEVANATLQYNSKNENIDFESFSETIKKCFSCDLMDSVIFVNTNSVENENYRLRMDVTTADMYNIGEADFIAKLCEYFIKLGQPAEDIGVISIYRFQAHYLRQKINQKVEINTVDQFQGRDKSLVIVSLVWTESLRGRSELLGDSRRINVAISRAKHKLILVGCRKSLSQYPAISALINAIPVSNLLNI